ncbi:NADPH-cytochrome p450 reductase [Schizosaccharomyces cryophilus OY26]|uniref:NADPH--cytochrome P450 reductase n=1 Tax=Schizosaccharomyces cryophilus (strain OY26 / ATCC MYA-4695 / CBS 11777 / NBRC 106824 / NRRL Y48691) TaxID=653667 RepID=S9X3G1_SCHCR|nr:NADPH-cytochrome p450 reductase [Schizosaccharomyces cryophilus OY26]EPY51642.1 NADPH-cytochrome p450 reductase [Schizosaccharomyces cryophilus OY26]
MKTTDIIGLGIALIITFGYFAYNFFSSRTKHVEKEVVSSNNGVFEKIEEENLNAMVLFGSQTGTAEDFAYRFSTEAKSKYKFANSTEDLDDFDFTDMDKLDPSKLLVFFLATYGEGEPTDNAESFIELIESEDTIFSSGNGVEDRPLANVRYAIFGLGNHTYEHYNAMAKRVDSAMNALGAQRIGPIGLGDDAAGLLEEDYLQWKDEVFPEIAKVYNLKEVREEYKPLYDVIEKPDISSESPTVFLGESSRQQLKGIVSKAPPSPANPFNSTPVVSRELFKNDTRNCLHLELDISGSNMKYQTGDYVSICPMNPSQAVDELLDILGLKDKRNMVVIVKPFNPLDKLPILSPTTYDAVFRYYFEICGIISRQLIFLIAPFAPTDEAKNELTKLGSDKDYFKANVADMHLNLAQVLRRVSSGIPYTKLPFSLLLENLGHLKPRYYSISSSSLSCPDKVHVTAVVDRKEWVDQNHIFYGLTTNYLLAHCLHQNGELTPHPNNLQYTLEGPRQKLTGKIPMFIKRSTFHLAPPEVPIIMVGPGTGIAPFRGFVMERAHLASQGVKVAKTILFYGCRRSDTDFLYKEEWDTYKNLMKDSFELYTAFSREQDQKLYVQHRLLQQSALVNELISAGAWFYICGDAERMAKDVTNALATILTTVEEDGAKRIKSLRDENRFLEDTW